MHHAYAIEGEAEAGIEAAEKFLARELGVHVRGNPDVVVLRYGLFSVEEARKVADIAAQGPIAGEKKAIIIAAARAYHEAQNALLKLFEEPPRDTYLFFILPALGALLPTLRSRVELWYAGAPRIEISGSAKKFLSMNQEKRSAWIKRMASGKDEEERRKNRDEAIGVLNGIEVIAHERWGKKRDADTTALLKDISFLRQFLHDRAAPTRMILEHLSLVVPSDLL